MSANVMVIVERQFDYPRATVFQAWTDPAIYARWRGSPGWHVENETLSGERELGGRHRHVKVRDNDFVSRERITGDPGIDPNVPLELRVEFTKYGRDGTLLRIIQGPYDPDVAGWHGEGWEKELNRLADLLDGRGEYAGGEPEKDGGAVR